MRRLRMALSFFVRVALVASGLAHSLLGWKQPSAELAVRGG